MANDNNDDDDLPITYQGALAKTVGKAGAAVLGTGLDRLRFPFGQGGEPGQPAAPDDVPIKYEHYGDAKDMGPPVDVKPGQFRPTPEGTGDDDDTTGVSKDFKQKLTSIESNGDPKAVNPDTGAVGKYQFVPSQWDSYFKKNLGFTTADMKPRDDSPEEQARAGKLQDQAFDFYMQHEVTPGIEMLRNKGLGKNYDDDQLAYLIHHEGLGSAQKELASGKFPGPTDSNPVGMDDLLARMKGGKFGVPRKGGPLPSDAADTRFAQTTRKNDSGSMDRLGGVNIDDVADTHLDDSKDPAVKQTAYDVKSALASGDRDDFANELRKIQSDFADVKDTIAKRELAHTIADALTKMAGGAYGMKTHVDMSHINTGEHNFQKDTELAQNEYKMKTDDLRGRSDQDLRTREAAADMLYKQNDLGLRTDEYKHRVAKDAADVGINAARASHEMNYQDAMADYHRAYAATLNEQKGESRAARIAEAKQKLDEATQAGIVKVLTSKEIGKDEDRAAAIAPYLAGRGLKSEDVFNALHKKGLIWGTNVKDADEMGQAVFDLLNKAPAPKSMQLTYKNDKGETKIRGYTDAQELERDKQLIQQGGGQVIHG